MQLENFFFYLLVSTSIVIFVYVLLQMLANYEKRKGLSGTQILSLIGLVFLSEYVVWMFSPEELPENTCSMALLFVIAVIDAQTGYVYNFFSYIVLFMSGFLAFVKWPLLSGYEVQLLLLFLLFVIGAVAFKGLGAGDVPIYFSLMFYYLRYADLPAEAVVFMLLVSQFLFGACALIRRKKQLPLIPYIWMAHLVTLCIWL